MATVLYLKKNKIETLDKPHSFLDMIFDPQKRKQTFEFYDNRYKETEEEKNILEIMTRKRKDVK